jgi:hypothetical protein
MTNPDAYFERTGTTRYRATQLTGGAWDPAEQHIAPALGLLAHVVETDRDARRDDGLVLGRLSYDILGTVPIDHFDLTTRVLRPGRTVELAEATLAHGGRPAVVLRAWLMRPTDTAAAETSHTPAIAGPDDVPHWDPTEVWPGGFVASLEVRRTQQAPGRAVVWVRTEVPLLADEPISPTSAAAGLFDIANGMTPAADPATTAFPNIDLTAHLHTAPTGSWVGFDTTVTLGPAGRGLTHSTLHDRTGPTGALAQCLAIAPRGT